MNCISSQAPIQQHAWLLYADLNSRFNTLLDECEHLRTTIFGLLPWEFPYAACDAEHLSPELMTNYRSSNAREKTFFSLFRLLRTLSHAIQKNKKACLEAFSTYAEKSVATEAAIQESASEAFFWFVAQRAYFIDQGFRIYTRELEHAHEKLIQILENSPGATPQPVLLRRWNSATYEDFLSGYFSHVKWEVRTLVAELLKNPKRNELAWNLTHSWTHVETSAVTVYQTEGTRKSEAVRHGSVRSAFFYLEQPALFPLLYHESGHFYFPSESECRAAPRGSFFSELVAATDTLKRGFPYPQFSKDWLDAFITEVWIDALAIRLSGVPYVSALFSQIFALSSPSQFLHNSTRQSPMVLAEFGQQSLRNLPVHTPDAESDNYLWEARLRLAIDICSQIGLERASQSERDWLESAGKLVDAWVEGGTRVFREEKTSSDHCDYWAFRNETNEWVHETLWSYLKPCLSQLRDFNQGWQYHFASEDPQNPVKTSPVKTIQKAVGNYLSTTFGEEGGDPSIVDALAGLVRVDACPVAVRWVIADSCFKHLLVADQCVSKRCSTYSDYVRHDGHAAFRLAMEWQLARDSFFQSLTSQEALPEPIKTVILRKSYDNYLLPFTAVEKACSECLENLLLEAEAQLNKMLAHFDNMLADGREVPIATLSLGLLRPADMALHEGESSPYLSRLNNAKVYFEKKCAKLCGLAGSVGGRYHSEFLGLIGDYSFAHLLRGITPVERDVQEEGTPKILTKPRAVIVASELQASEDQVIGKLTLCRQDFRFHWIELAEQLKTENIAHQLCLSSGWEDVILITWHRSMEDMQASRRALGLIHRGLQRHDAQSVLAFKTDEVKVPNAKVAWGKEWGDSFRSMLPDCVASRYELMGRYDFTVTWKHDKVNSPLSMAAVLGGLPKEFWKPLTHYSIAIRQSWDSKDSLAPSEFISRFVLE